MKQISYSIPWFPFCFELWHYKESYEGLRGEEDGYYTITDIILVHGTGRICI